MRQRQELEWCSRKGRLESGRGRGEDGSPLELPMDEQPCPHLGVGLPAPDLGGEI